MSSRRKQPERAWPVFRVDVIQVQKVSKPSTVSYRVRIQKIIRTNLSIGVEIMTCIALHNRVV